VARQAGLLSKSISELYHECRSSVFHYPQEINDWWTSATRWNIVRFRQRILACSFSLAVRICVACLESFHGITNANAQPEARCREWRNVLKAMGTKRHDHTNRSLMALDWTGPYCTVHCCTKGTSYLCLSTAVMTLSHRDLKTARFPHISVHWLHCSFYSNLTALTSENSECLK
jgi:hypothetical protein